MTDNLLKEERGRIIVTAVQQHKIYNIYEKNPSKSITFTVQQTHSEFM